MSGPTDNSATPPGSRLHKHFGFPCACMASRAVRPSPPPWPILSGNCVSSVAAIRSVGSTPSARCCGKRVAMSWARAQRRLRSVLPVSAVGGLGPLTDASDRDGVSGANESQPLLVASRKVNTQLPTGLRSNSSTAAQPRQTWVRSSAVIDSDSKKGVFG